VLDLWVAVQVVVVVAQEQWATQQLGHCPVMAE
jgi:hypothetical protein